MSLRGTDDAGRFVEDNNAKSDAWKNVCKSDKLIKKYGGDIFSKPRLFDGLHSVVDKNEPTNEKDLAKQQRLIGSMAHLALQGVKNFTLLYKKLNNFLLRNIGEALTKNPDYTGEEDIKHSPYNYSKHQFVQLQKVFQLDVGEPVTNVARTAAGAFTDSLDKRREKIISRIRKSNGSAASAITRTHTHQGG